MLRVTHPFNLLYNFLVILCDNRNKRFRVLIGILSWLDISCSCQSLLIAGYCSKINRLSLIKILFIGYRWGKKNFGIWFCVSSLRWSTLALSWSLLERIQISFLSCSYIAWGRKLISSVCIIISLKSLFVKPASNISSLLCLLVFLVW